MANTLSQQQVEQFLKGYGFQGSATGGAAQAFMNTNPAAATAFQQYASTPGGNTSVNTTTSTLKPATGNNLTQDQATQWGLAMGLLKPGETATGGLLQRRIDDPNDDITNETYGQFQRNLATGNGGLGQGGVDPLSVADLTDWQKQALQLLAGGNTAGQQYYDQAGQMLKQVQDMITSSGKAPTTEELLATINAVRNPLEAQVREQGITDIQSAGDRARARIMAQYGGSDSSAAGVQLSELDKNIADTIARLSTTTGFDAFNTAAGVATQQLDRTAASSANAARTATVLPQLALTQGSTARANNLEDIKNLLGAGTTVQNQNQKLLDAITGQYQQQDSFDLEMIQALAQILGMTPTAGGTKAESPNTASRLSDLAQVLAPMF